MAARKCLLPQPAEASSEDPKRKVPSLTRNFLFDAVSPEFDPNRALLQGVYIIDEEKTRYASI